MILASNGLLYGLTRSGGTSGLGTLFEYDYVNNTYTKKVDFSGTTTGSQPSGSLIQALNGKLYGLSQNGGVNATGTLFDYDYSTNTFTKEYDFNATSGTQPLGSLVLANDGNLYGLTRLGATNSLGSLFQYDFVNNVFTKKVDLTATVGSSPNSSLVKATNGKLYGIFTAGGTSSVGTIGEYDVTLGTLTKLIDLNNTTGYAPAYTRLIEVCPKPGLPTITSATTAVCELDATTKSFSVASVATATSYAWTMPVGSSIVSGSLTNNIGVNFSSLVAGVYSFSAAGVNYCGTGSIAVSNVTVHATPTISVNSGTICTGNSFTIVPSGASTYVYSGGTSVVAPLTNTSYNVVGTSSLGCVSSNTAVASVVVNLTPTISVNSGSICSGNSFTLNPSGATSYVYSSGSAVVSPLTNTSYSVTGSSAQGCVSTNTAVSNVTVNTTPTLSVNSGSICTGNSFTMIPTGANNYVYSSGSSVVSPLTNTSYTITGSSTQGCPASNTVVSSVTVNITPTVSVNSGTICSGNSFIINPSGASTYVYSGGSATVSPATTTAYSITGTSAQGCISSNTAVSDVTVYITPTVSVNSGSICTGNSFVLNPSGANTYVFSSGTATVSPLTNTSYSVTGSSIQGCVSSNTAVSNVTVNITPTVAVNSGSICTGNSFTMSPSGASSYVYSGGSAIVSPLINTSYSVTGTSAQGCVSTNTAVSNVTVYITPTVTVNSGTICTGNSFTMAPNGAFTYVYSGGSAIVSPLTNTSYSVIGTSAQGCVSSNTAISSVTVYLTPTISVNSGSICTGNSFTMNPTGASTYIYSSGSPIVSPLVNSSYNVTGTSAQGCAATNTAVSSVTVYITPTVSVNSGTICTGNSFTMVPGGATFYNFSSGSAIVSPLTDTSYSVTGTSVQGCVSSNTAVSSITVYITPTVSVNSGTMCTGNSFTLVPGGATFYNFSSGSPIVSPLVNTTYSVTGTSAQGCVSTNTAVSNVTVFVTPTVSVNSGTICSGNSFTMLPGGASTYVYSGGSQVVSPLINTSYSVTGTSAQGCVSSNTAVSNVTVFITPTVSVNSGTICSGGSFTMLPTGASTYVYSSGSPVVSPLTTSSYSVTGNSAQGCVSTNTAISTVTVFALPVITAASGSICLGSSFVPTVTGASTYTYSGSIPLTPTANITYTVIGSNAATGCISNPGATFAVVVNNNPAINISGTNTLCLGGAVTLTASGANSYTWSTGNGPTVTLTPTATANYSVFGTSAAGCASNAVISISVFPNPTITVASGGICIGDSFTLNPSGAVTYTYLPVGPIVTPSITTVYNINGTNAFGCSMQNPVSATVTVGNTLSVSISGNTFVCVGQTVNLTANGASSYTWSNGTQQNNISTTPSVNTSYTVLGSSSSCSASAVVVVTVNPLPNIGVICSPSVICNGESSTITASGANTYSWFPVASFTTPVIIVSPVQTINYIVSGTDANGCTNSSSTTLTVNDCIGISKNQFEQANLNVYPNPNAGTFYVQSAQAIHIFVYNSLGQIVHEQSIEMGINEVKLNDQAKGIYFVRCMNGSNDQFIRIIKE